MSSDPFAVPRVGLCLAPLLIFAFAWPGRRLVEILNQEQRWDRAAAWALGFLLSFGWFTFTELPALLLHWSSSTGLVIALVGWGIGAVAVEVALRRSRASSGAPPRETEAPDAAPSPARENDRWVVLLLLILSAGAAMATAVRAVPRSLVAAGWGLLGMSTVLLALRRFRKRSTDRAVALTVGQTKIAAVILGCLVVGSALSSFAWVREDADDTLYSTEALLLRDSPAMGLYAPAHRGELLPPEKIYVVQSFELWAAVISRLTGLHPLVVLRSLLAPVVVLLAYCLYFELLKRIVPRELVVVAAVGTVAYFLFGISSHFTTNNYLLSRSAQGKTWLMHVAIPGLTLLALELSRRPSKRLFGCLLATSVAAMGMAPTAAALVPVHLGALGLAHWITTRNRAGFGRFVLVAAASLPCVIFIAWIAAQRSEIKSYLDNGSLHDVLRWRDMVLFFFLNFGERGGGIELFAFVAFPLLLACVAWKRVAQFPLIYLGILFVTVLNPWLVRMTTSLISWDGVVRMLWLVPVPILFGGVVALVAALCLAAAPRTGAIVGLGLVLAAMPLMGGRFAWSKANLFLDPIDFSTIRRAENLFKVPAPLLTIATRLTGKQLGPERRVLCSERDASHLTPLVSEMDFVYTRDFQTLDPLTAVGRETEGRARRRLAREFLRGEMNDQEAAASFDGAKAEYVIVDPESDNRTGRTRVEGVLGRRGFQRTVSVSGYDLWERPSRQLDGTMAR
jgi:hypothetical protein